jgi:peroxiredoxin
LRRWDASGINTAQVGQLAPDFELPQITGESTRLAHYRGKQPVVIVFVYGDT